MHGCDGKPGEYQVEYENLADDLRNRKAVLDRTLIEMAAMRYPKRLASADAQHQCQRRVGEIVERQQQRGDYLMLVGELQQTPSEQKSDRQRTNVAEKNLCDRSVERRKAQHGAAKRGGYHGG